MTDNCQECARLQAENKRLTAQVEKWRWQVALMANWIRNQQNDADKLNAAITEWQEEHARQKRVYAKWKGKYYSDRMPVLPEEPTP